jgi:hypothetical protein
MSETSDTQADIQADAAWPLHVRAAWGESLTSEEQTQLAQWYASQEQIEMAVLSTGIAPVDVVALQAQVNAMLEQIATATDKIKQLTQENEALRTELAKMRRQLS